MFKKINKIKINFTKYKYWVVKTKWVQTNMNSLWSLCDCENHGTFIQIRSQESGTYGKGEISSGLKYVQFEKIKIK